MAFITKVSRFIGYLTAALAAITVLLFGLWVIAPSVVGNCVEGAHAYQECYWRGRDVSDVLNWLVWAPMITWSLFLATGLSWLATKSIVEWGNPDFTYTRWWLLMILAIIVLAFFVGPSLLLDSH